MPCVKVQSQRLSKETSGFLLTRPAHNFHGDATFTRFLAPVPGNRAIAPARGGEFRPRLVAGGVR
jgi:hypothetical protein